MLPGKNAIISAAIILFLGASITTLYATSRFEPQLKQQIDLSANSASLFVDQLALQMRSLRLAAEQIRLAVMERPAEAATQAALARLRAELPTLRTVIVLDAQGVVRADMRDGEPAVGLDVSDRAYFKAHLNTPKNRLYVGSPVASRIDGEWTMPLSLAARTPEGALKAVIVVSVDRQFFASMSDRALGDDMTAFLGAPESGAFFSLGDDAITAADRAAMESEYAKGASGVVGQSLGRKSVGDALFFFHELPGGRLKVTVRFHLDKARGTARDIAEHAFQLGLSLTVFLALCAATGTHALDVLARREKRAAMLEERLRLATDVAQIGIWDLDIVNDVNVWDETMHKIYGVDPGCYEGDYAGWRRRVHPDDIDDAEAAINATLEQGDVLDMTFRIVTDPGRVRHLAARARVYRDGAAKPVRLLGVNFDISENVLREEELTQALDAADAARTMVEAATLRAEHDAMHDALTGLPNRRQLTARIDTLPASANGRLVLSLDLDRFKPVNDLYGHAAGDALLQHVAQQLRAALGPKGFAARIGGDEFVAILPAQESPDAEARCRAIMSAVTTPLNWEGAVLQVGCSIGYLLADNAITVQEHMKCADIALTKAKTDGRNRIVAFDEDLAAEARERLDIADDFRRAIAERAITPHFQPQIDVRTGMLWGVEALARWPHPERGFIPPSVFIPIAEELKMSGELDRLILDKTIEQLREWRETGVDVPRVSVNVSARRLRSSGLIAEIFALTEEDRAQLTFEILESVYIDETDEETLWVINELRTLGLRIEIDDFGSGHASVASIMALRPDALKLDRMFARDVDKAPEALAILRSLLGVAASLKLPVIAEGVETETQAAVLAAEGCAALQGFGIGRPMPAEAFEEWLVQRAAPRKTA